MTTLTISACEDLLASIFRENNTAPGNAAATARALVAAEADGLKGHGFSRVPTYAEQARIGKADGSAVPTAQRDGAIVRIDAAHGFAYPAIDLALEEMAQVLAQSGVAIAAIRRSHHCGVLGHPVEALARKGFVALMFANTPPAIAAWGGSKPIFGTNPIAFAAPLGDEVAVVDLSLSKVARGNILKAAQTGDAIPQGWALDADGQPTTDPNAALAGTMVPMGEAKGVALAMMVEVLAAGITGATFSSEATSFLNMEGGPPSVGQLIIAIDPARTGGSVAHMGHLAASYAAEPGARLPGSRRLENRAKAAEEGLVVPQPVLDLAPGGA